ncbi:MAG: gamma-glutamyltransferase family protein [Pseudomonadales bacterium]
MDWGTPYPSNRSPLFARNIVATSQPLAAQAGIDALRAGGNAVDAALATAITLTVVEPNNNGIGSDAFAMVWDGKRLHGLNASGRSPAAWSPERFASDEKMPTWGWEAVTVPGAVSAWVALSDKFGKLPFDALFQSAIHYATEGYPVGPKSGVFWQYAENTYRDFENFRHTFLPGGKAPAIGSTIQLPDHATSLQKIAESKGDAFYHGDLADAIVADARANNAAMTHEDLANHRCDWVEPISQSLGDVDLHEIPPNGQGLMALIALGIIERLDLARYKTDSADSVHLQLEATRIAYAEIERHLADIDQMLVSPAQLLAPKYLKRRSDEIDTDKANPRPTALGTSPDTVYLTTADASGTLVSMIQSNYRGFGSGVVIPGTGISMQNRGSGFTLEPGHPNQVAGGKRPYHTIIPGFVTSGGQARMSFGVMGGHMQAQGHLQMMIRIFINGQNPQAATDAPRWYLQEDGIVCLEDGFDREVASELKRRGHDIRWNNPEHLFGGAQLIYRLDEGYCAGSDHRKEGLAIGF